MLGAYLIPGTAATLAGGTDPRLARLREAWPIWKRAGRPEGVLCVPKGLGDGQAPLRPDAYGPPQVCADGLVWLPPLTLPKLQDLAREEIPRESTTITLRRAGTISIPLGLGPAYGCGPLRGQPSSEFGRLSLDLHARAVEKGRTWTADDEADTERLVFLAVQQGYVITWELWGAMAPYDLDEVADLLQACWGSHPKASSDVGPTSPPSPLDASPAPDSLQPS